MFVNFIICFLIFSILSVFVCKKNNILVDFKLEKHKRFSTNLKSYSIGGILLIFFLYYYHTIILQNFLVLFFFSSIFLIGLLSDLKKLNSVSLRFFLQLILIIYFIQLNNIEILSTRINFFDELLDNNLINTFFVTFCLMILINGGNFIDGLNGLLLKYQLFIYLIILFNFDNFIIDQQFLVNLILIIIIILLFNLFGFLYMGDSGSYLLSVMTGVYLINFSNNNVLISPYLIILLLWYPCFELLFSMIRRSTKDIKTYKPDTNHLHHLVYKSFRNKFKIKNNLIIHLISSSSINLYNLISFLIGINFIYKSSLLIVMILINIIVYLGLYNFLKKKLKNN